MTTATPRARRTPLLPWRRLRSFDWPLLAATLAAIGIGVAVIYSATLRIPVTSAWDDLVVKQLLFAALGLAVMLLVSRTDYRVLTTFWIWIYVATVVLLAAASTVQGGSARWVTLFGIAVQTSEFAKVSLILCLAAYFERYDVRRVRHVLGSLALTALLMLLVLLQPNLSTALMLGAIWLGIAWGAGLRPLHLSALALTTVPAAWLTLKSSLIQGYMLDRVAAWLHPEADPLGAGFQNIQTLIAVGNGGLLGRGFASGSQAQGGWLPLIHTDNIFALLTEELGFVGGLLVLALLAYITWRVLRAAGVAKDRTGALIAFGVASYLMVQTVVNIGVVLQLLPVTGVSLPFISAGGSSLVALMLALGLVQAVNLRRKPLEFR